LYMLAGGVRRERLAQRRLAHVGVHGADPIHYEPHECRRLEAVEGGQLAVFSRRHEQTEAKDAREEDLADGADVFGGRPCPGNLVGLLCFGRR